MGLCLGSEVTEEDKKAKLHSAEIDRELYEHARREMNVVKVLLLGEETRCFILNKYFMHRNPNYFLNMQSGNKWTFRIYEYAN